jgi:hypothetical protein
LKASHAFLSQWSILFHTQVLSLCVNQPHHPIPKMPCLMWSCGPVLPTGMWSQTPSNACFQPLEQCSTCSTMFGYSLVCQIAWAHVGTFNWNAITAFLVALAAFEQTINLSGRRNSLWGMLLNREPARPFNNWSELQGFMNPDTYPCLLMPPNHGRFTPAGGTMTSCAFSLWHG